MIVVRALVLAFAVAIVAAAFGASQMQLQPSAQRLVITAGTALLAPLFWPGLAATSAQTILRIVNASAVAAIVAAALLLAMGGGRQSPGATVTACAMLFLIVLAAHALAAAIEHHMRAQGGDARSAAEAAGRGAALALAAVAAAPLWLGPAAELLTGERPWLTDAVVGLSPLTHLAIASGNDLLRNEWLYDRSNLARLAVSYPDLRSLLLSYVSLLPALALASVARRSPSRRAPVARIARPTTEDAP
jgi:hypothetical protein